MKRLDEIILKMDIHIDAAATEAATIPTLGHCDICDGLGVVRYNVPVGHEHFGRLMPCPASDCPASRLLKRSHSERLLRRSNWSDAYRRFTFEGFQDYLSSRSERDGVDYWGGKLGAFIVARRFAEDPWTPFSLVEAAAWYSGELRPPAGWSNIQRMGVTLTGDVGMGKTSLAAAVFNRLVERGERPFFLRVANIINMIQSSYGAQRDEYGERTEDVLAALYNADILIVDEFNIKNYKPDRLEKLEDIIRERYKRGLPFFITTNYSPEVFTKNWDVQISDIVKTGHWVPCAGAKLRETSDEAVPAW